MTLDFQNAQGVRKGAPAYLFVKDGENWRAMEGSDLSGSIENAGLLTDDYSWQPKSNNDILVAGLDALREIEILDPENTSKPITVYIKLTNEDGSGQVTFTNISSPGGIGPSLGSESGDVDIFQFLWEGQAWVLVNAVYTIQPV